MFDLTIRMNGSKDQVTVRSPQGEVDVDRSTLTGIQKKELRRMVRRALFGEGPAPSRPKRRRNRKRKQQRR